MTQEPRKEPLTWVEQFAKDHPYLYWKEYYKLAIETWWFETFTKWRLHK